MSFFIIDSEKCNRDELCVNACPTKVIRMGSRDELPEPIPRFEGRSKMASKLNTWEEHLRQTFKLMNIGMIGMWRLGLGPWINAWPAVIGRIMVITPIGRKTGLRRRTPVNYAIVDGDV